MNKTVVSQVPVGLNLLPVGVSEVVTVSVTVGSIDMDESILRSVNQGFKLSI